MLGYLGNTAASSASFDSDGFLKSGDVAYCRKGKWYIVDRRKELIKVRGWQVAPTELEAVLLTHREIIDAAVIGVTPPGTASEVPRAYVTISKGSTLTEGEVKAYLAARLSKYKHLDGGVAFLDCIPKSPSGKILKKLLRSDLPKAEQAFGLVAMEKDHQHEKADIIDARLHTKSAKSRYLPVCVAGALLLGLGWFLKPSK
jgi:acyl-CoA synthetase (AMP-forming)/AMP-acid ligase II